MYEYNNDVPMNEYSIIVITFSVNSVKNIVSR